MIRPTRVLTIAFLAIALTSLTFTSPRFARADNLADEAELQFEMAAEQYKAGHFREALQHFLESNRLVQNHNVIFNIARTYEQLHRNPDAFRYYTQALDGETDVATRRRIEEAIARISPFVAVLKVTTDPPGATIYLERKDLGARGNSPALLGVEPHSYKVIAELPGYESQTTIADVKVGSTTPVTFKLKQIRGTLRVEGQPAGAAVHIDTEEGAAAGFVPCDLGLPPGRHAVYISKEGFQSQSTVVDIVADQTATTHTSLNAVTGSLLVNADARDVLISVDGKPTGFTPAVLNVPVGTHVVRLTQSGFRPFEQTVTLTNGTQTRIDAELTQVEEVTAASRSTESVEDAPSSVSIISAQELRAMNYPTIAEAIRGIRGVYLSDDRSYVTAGFRGSSQEGDYGAHVLVLVDGASTNDDFVGSSYIGYDARVDIDDIERIEVVRGPGSVLYGTGAFFGVINLVTRNKNAPTHGEVAVSSADYGMTRARVTGQVRLSPDSGAWASVAAAHSNGRDFYFSDYASDPATGGNARGLDGFDAATTNGNAWYKAFNFQWLFTSRKKSIPTGEYGTTFGDPRSHLADTRGLAEIRFEPVVSDRVQLLSRAHFNLYNFDDELAYTPDQGGVAAEAFRGRWVGLEQRIVLIPVMPLKITIGGEFQRHFEANQTGNCEFPCTPASMPTTPIYLSRNTPFTLAAGYGNIDWTPVHAIKITAGARGDYDSLFGSSVNPRLAVIVHPYDRGVLKFLAGKAFRAPSVYELYYQGPLQAPSNNLKPEDIYSGEIEFTHRFWTTVTATGSVFTNYVNNLINLIGDGTYVSPNLYVNSATPILTEGAEFEVRRDWRQGWMLGATYSYQHSRYLDNDNGALRNIPNSPNHLGSLKAAAPIVSRALSVMTRVSFEGPRYDKNDRATDPPQTETQASAVWDIIFSGDADKVKIHYAIGLYNAADAKYYVPVSREFSQTTIVQNGRTLLANAQLSF
jgi:outer membrane receptor for ferrienterochelin and colicin